MTFSATEAVFEGFRLVRRKPSVLIWWTLAFFVILAICGAVVAAPMSAIFQQLKALEESNPTSIEEFQPVFAAYAGMMAVFLPLGLLFNAVAYSAVARGVLQPTKGAWGYLRLGGDELRVLLVNLVLSLLLMAVYLAFVFAGFAAFGAGQAMNAPFMYLLGAVVMLLGLGVLIWLAVRLSLAVPLVIDGKKINFFGSFRLTKGKFWPLSGMGILAWLISVVITILFSLVAQPLMLLVGSDLQAQMAQISDPSELIPLLQQNLPELAVLLLTNAISTALTLAIMTAPFSAAYKQLKPSSAV